MAYLNEEQYKKNNQKVKTAGLVLMVIGIIMLIVALFVIKVPDMGEEGWFETKTTSTRLKMFGLFLTIIGCVIRFFIGNQRQINAYMAQQQIPIVQEGMEKMAPSMGKAAKEITKGIKEGLKDDEK